MASGDREIEALAIGEQLMKELSALDHVAFVRFASVYRSFQDGCKPLFTCHALTPTAHLITFIRQAGIYHPSILSSTEWTTHRNILREAHKLLFCTSPAT
jgi:hypothetical protein